MIPGNEFAGVVDQVGDGVSGLPEGTEVFGYATLGCYAEYRSVPADQIVVTPSGMPWEIAGGFSANGQGAHPGDTVLIHGAAGVLGTFAVLLANAWGATTVIGTCSEGNHDHPRSLGAIPVTYGDGLVERIFTVSPNGADALRASAVLVKDRNRIRTMIDDDIAVVPPYPERPSPPSSTPTLTCAVRRISTRRPRRRSQSWPFRASGTSWSRPASGRTSRPGRRCDG